MICEIRKCSNWAEITECLGEFPPPKVSIDVEDGITTGIAAETWVFRGLKASSYELQPAIEREAESKTMDWAALEELVSFEFKARARMHLSASLIPADEVTWLAQMQHYGIPTRLLDFTYSPFVALYFAIRNGYKGPDRVEIRLCALNASAVNRSFRRTVREAERKATRENPEKKEFKAWNGNVVSFSTDLDSIIPETQGLPGLVAKALAATGERRDELNRSGCVCVASPPTFNPRLVNQQGIFLLNCALGRSFMESLTKMMGECSGWLKTIDIPVDLISEIETRLFQMNIHEQSLFPDMEGLAGLIRQKLRLHWK